MACNDGDAGNNDDPRVPGQSSFGMHNGANQNPGVMQADMLHAAHY